MNPPYQKPMTGSSSGFIIAPDHGKRNVPRKNIWSGEKKMDVPAAMPHGTSHSERVFGRVSVRGQHPLFLDGFRSSFYFWLRCGFRGRSDRFLDFNLLFHKKASFLFDDWIFKIYILNHQIRSVYPGSILVFSP